MLDYTSTELLLKAEAADRKRERDALRGAGDDREQAGILPYFDLPIGDGGAVGEPVTAPLSSAADGAAEAGGDAADLAGEAATGFLEAAAHVAGEILKVLGEILVALGEADWD